LEQSTALTRRWQAPLASVSAASGVFWGSFGVAFTDFITKRELSYAAAGNLLAALSIMSILIMLFVAHRLETLERRWAVGGGAAVTTVGIALLVLAPDAALLLAFLVVGVGQGLEDVFVNATGQEVEVRSRLPVLQRLHGAYSLGAALGALGTGVGLQAGLGYETLLLVAAAVHLLGTAHATVQIADLRDHIRREPSRMSLSVLVSAPVLLVPALVLAAAYFVEGSMDVWSVLYLRESLEAGALVGAWGLAAFNFAMALGRLFAARVLFRFGAATTLVASGLGSMAAGTVALVVTEPLVAASAFLVLGFAMAAAGPAAIGMVAGAGVNVGLGIAAISTVGYSGFVLGPPLLGWIAQAAGVRATMTVIVLATLGIALAGLLTPRRTEEAGAA
jgi:MFS family permease